jgi:glucosamine--fructose-6-phosphate aminotransferase (isomerizing)
MCGIVGAVAERDVVPILVEGLKRLEYRGYDSAGVVVLDEQNCLDRVRTPGKVAQVEAMIKDQNLRGSCGIAHTRWATHGKPTQANAHPHICRKTVAVVHNGIIENHALLRADQRQAGYEFTSETDTEVVVHQIHHHLQSGKNLLAAVQAAVGELHGTYALGVVSNMAPGVLVAARRGSPLVIGIGIGEHFIASDVAALIPVTQRFIFLEDGDVAEITRDRLTIFNAAGEVVERPLKISELTVDAVERGQYRHYMLK